MSEENVEVVRGLVELFRWTAEGPPPGERFGWELWDPEADYYPSPKFPESRPCHGREEIVRFFQEYLPAWEWLNGKPINLVAVGDDRVLAHTILLGEGRGSGLELRAELYQCFWLRGGRILRAEDHFTPEAALRAFGLDEHGPEAAGLQE